MSAQGNVAPIIIKKKKVMGGDGHHGGAWKVAMDYSFRRQCFAPVSCLGDPGGLLPSDICSAEGRAAPSARDAGAPWGRNC